MFRSKFLPLAAFAILSGSVLVLADDPATPPAAPHLHLVKPWSELTDLTEEQKTKISDIHVKVTAEIKAIHEKEKSDVAALLTDDQKKAIVEFEAKDKLKTASPATQPAK
jgi:Spy/CpxP family protein refolding chaperone